MHAPALGPTQDAFDASLDIEDDDHKSLEVNSPPRSRQGDVAAAPRPYLDIALAPRMGMTKSLAKRLGNTSGERELTVLVDGPYGPTLNVSNLHPIFGS